VLLSLLYNSINHTNAHFLFSACQHQNKQANTYSLLIICLEYNNTFFLTMAAQAQEANQLESITDRIEDQDIDDGKTELAMLALATADKVEATKATALSSVEVSKDDVAVIMEELEVTEDIAELVLREVTLPIFLKRL
jgi:hypothetical protein